jgi:siroheme synthase
MRYFKLSMVFLGLLPIIFLATTTGCAPVSGNTMSPGAGTLSLVSVGTGDPDNMTIRARKTIMAADIVFTMGARTERYGDLLRGKPVHDAGHRLFASAATAGHTGPRLDRKTKMVNKQKNKPAGDGHWMRKSPAQIAAQQEETRRIIRDAVAAGKHVVILDNGDPTIFGPHIDYMREFTDLNPEIVPGLSSFNAANAALQTSVVGGSTRAVTLTMGRLDNGRDEILARMIAEGTTLAFFMVRDLDAFIAGLNARLPGNTPVAIVGEAGSRQRQRVIRATLDTILANVGEEKLPAYLLYVGGFLR